MADENKDSYRVFLQYAGLVTQLGLTMIGSIIVGTGIGYLVDRMTGVKTVFTILFLLLGIGAGFWNTYRLIMSKLQQ